MKELEIFGQRLKNARIMKCLSMDELCSKMNNTISKMAISKYERGELSPNSNILIKFSEALGQPVDYFFRPFALHISDIQFRKKSKLPVKQANSIKETIADNIEKYINIEEICNSIIDFKKPNWEVSNSNEAKKYALQLRHNWQIGNDGILNLVSLLEEHGIKILFIDADESFDGLSTIVNDAYPVIVLNSYFITERNRFTTAHELGHIMLSFEKGAEQKEIERLCNVFASEFLIPSEALIDELGSKRTSISIIELEHLQRQFGISKDALIYKAKENNVISQSLFESCMKRKNSQPSFKAIMESSVYCMKETSDRFQSLVYMALNKGMISESKASALLNVPQETFRNANSAI